MMYEVISMLIVTLTIIHQSHSQLECGKNVAPTVRIVGGKQVEDLSWPWMVSLNAASPSTGKVGSKRGHICGGVLLHNEWVMTAAHCLDDPDNPNDFTKPLPANWRITVGMHTRSPAEAKKGFWQHRKIKKIFPHPNFHDYTVTAFNDIALIQLEKPVVYNNRVRPICFPKKTTKPGWNQCYTAGWGTKSEKSPHYSLSLQEVPILIVNYLACRERYGQAYSQYHHLCGGDWFLGGKDSCKGDSGGPLACKNSDGSWYVSGIVSWGIGCGRKKTPGVYTNVVKYERWVKTIIVRNTPRPTQRSFVPKGFLLNKQRKRRSLYDNLFNNDTN